jgi:hypothetical protein
VSAHPTFLEERLHRRPVFLHTGWRSAGTWLWTLFRAHPDALGLYEPLHEMLATLRGNEIAGMRIDAWSGHGHPAAMRPYFDEYRPLFVGNAPGVPGYRAEFALDHYFAGPTTELPALKAYVQSLLVFAASRGKTPVLKFCRSMGRAGWMRQTFPQAAHVGVLRNPWSQWISAWRIFTAHRNPYFVSMPLIIIAQNRNDSALSIAIDMHKLRLLPELRTFHERHKACRRALRRESFASLYRSFLTVWTLDTVGTLRSAELTIDVDQLSTPGSYRAETARELEELTGLAVTLDDARVSREPLPKLRRRDLAEIESCHRDALAFVARLESATDLAPNSDAFAITTAKLNEASGFANESLRAA